MGKITFNLMFFIKTHEKQQICSRQSKTCDHRKINISTHENKFSMFNHKIQKKMMETNISSLFRIKT